MKKQQLVLHVGLMKTATTYVQSILARNRDVLSQNGWSYPGSRENQQHAFYGICGESIPWVTPEIERNYKQLGDKLRESLKDHEENVIISSEALSTLKAEGIEALIQEIASPTKIIFTIRGLDKIIPSAWQQYLKGGGTRTLPQFIEDMHTSRNPVEQVKGFWQTYAYGECVKRWAQVTGKPVDVVVLPRQPKGRTEAWHLFQAAANLPDLPDLEVPKVEENVSFSAEAAEIVRKFNRMKSNGNPIPASRRHRFLKQCIFPTAAEQLGNRIDLPAEYSDIVARWNAEEKAKTAEYTNRVIGNLDDL